MEISVRGDLWNKDGSKSEGKGLQDCSEACYDVWLGDGGFDKMIEGWAGGGRAEDGNIFIEYIEYIRRPVQLSSLVTKLDSQD